jgi:hypothetical protein
MARYTQLATYLKEITKMTIYRASVTVEALYIEAKNKAEAEAKYDAWFSQDDCPEHNQSFDECDCVEHQEEVDHDMEVYA